MNDFREERERAVERLVRAGYIKDRRVIEALKRVPRHLFVPEKYRKYAYVDEPLPIGENQTISAIHMVGIMAELLEVEEGMKILEIGAGSGYHAAVLAELVGESGIIYSVERIPKLAEMARRNLERAGYKNVIVLIGDGSKGLPEKAPFDRISVTAAAPEIPRPLVEQLKDGGIMVIPVGRIFQELKVVRKKGDEVTVENWGAVSFVPLIGEYGFRK
ncbi:MAG: protein-L-isoaspartate(D-aspartate) O-methyltransferase [Archaeoglobi archaeon]|nr:protein-L-isoaspartate(D-aspartate) O-methyltransferase [Archaeoglobi archaeon]